MPSKKLIVFCCALLILCFVSALLGQEKKESTRVYANQQIPFYTFHVSQEQADSLHVRLHIQQLINQTYDDELHGIVDLKKYDEIHSLVATLPSSGARPKHEVHRATN
jgi:hypothetical protein